jgi:hypothetical protein
LSTTGEFGNVSETAPQGGLDTFTRRYLVILGSAIVAGLAWWLVNTDSRVSELNAMLAADPQLAGYPFPFRVLALEGGVADMNSPRSANVSAIQGLRAMFPELRRSSAVSPEMMAAQETLAEVQSRAADLVTRQEDVDRVRWVLDESWLAGQGIFVQ